MSDKDFYAKGGHFEALMFTEQKRRDEAAAERHRRLFEGHWTINGDGVARFVERQRDGRPGMEVFVKDRGLGKTFTAVKWVMGGVKIDRAPGWSRIILVSTKKMKDWMLGEHRQLQGGQVQIFEYVVRGQRLPRGVEYAIDDAEQVLLDFVHRHGLDSPALVTFTGTDMLREAEILTQALADPVAAAHRLNEIQERLRVVLRPYEEPLYEPDDNP